jgi:homoserine kinase
LRAYGEEPTADHLFRLVTELEGHPDNAAAAVLGGFVAVDAGGRPHRLPWNVRFRPVLAVPHRPFPTSEARQRLPGVYAPDVVVRTLGRMSSLLLGLELGDEALLAGAAGDELHEAPRNHIRPDVAGLISAARQGGAAHACWSGAGPSVLALVTNESLGSVTTALEHRLGEDGIVIVLDVASRGAF